MSGGEREGGGGKAVLSGERTSSSCSSYSGSEPCSEFSLPSTNAGPTVGDGGGAGGAGRRLVHGKASDSGKNHTSSHQQLKYYGRRNRAKQAASSHQDGEGGGDRGEAEEASLGGGRLAVDLTGHLETGREERSKLFLDSRNGSGGNLLSGKILRRSHGSVRSRDVTMEPEAIEGSNYKDAKEAIATGDQGKTSGESNDTEHSSEVTRSQENTGSPQVEDRDKRVNGVVVDPEAFSEVGNSYPPQLSQEQDGLEGPVLKDNVVINEVTGTPQSSLYKLFGKKGGSSASFAGDPQTVEDEEVEGKVRREDRNGADPHPSVKGVKAAREAPVRRSTTSIVKIIGALRNGDSNRHRKKGLGHSSSRLRKTRAQYAKDEGSQGEEDISEAYGGQGNSALRKMSLQQRLDLERQKYEESVLAKAEEVQAKQEVFDSSKRIALKGKEPARCKTHWDFVLEEMVWLSKDFEKERKWKLSQAKKVAVRVSRSKLDVEAKGLRRLKEEEQRTRRVASNIAKDVKKFWMKVEKLVLYKHQLNVEDRRKKALDKHLDFLLGQTERYSTMLAENLADNIPSPNPKALPLVPHEGAVAVDEADAVSLEQELLHDKSPGRHLVDGRLDDGDDDFDMDNEVDEEDDETTIAADEALVTDGEKREELSRLQRESELPLEELLKLYRREGVESDIADDPSDNDSEVNIDDEDNDSNDEDNDSNDEDNDSNDEDNDSNDEDNDSNDEDNDSNDENNEKAMKGTSEVFEENVSVPVHDDTRTSATLRSNWAKVGGVVENGIGASSSRQPVLEVSEDPFYRHDASSSVPGNISRVVKHQLLDIQGIEQDSQKLSGATRLDLSGSYHEGGCAMEVVSTGALPRHSQDLIDDGEYIPATLADGIEEDDETTLEEEERLAGADTVDAAVEVDLLQRESEMSVEELLAQYKSMAAAENEVEEFVEDRQDRTSEAGTSGSSDEDANENDYGIDVARDLAQAIERVGEPSTSGREQWSLVPSGYGRKLKKSMDRKAPFESNGNSSGGDGKMSGTWSQKQFSPDLGAGDDGGLGCESVTKGGPMASFLLQADDMVDADTIAVVTRVSEVAKRRGERVLKRSQREQEKPSTFPILVDQYCEEPLSVTVPIEVEKGDATTGRDHDVVRHFDDVNRAGSVKTSEGDVDHSRPLNLGLRENPVKITDIREAGSGGDQNPETVDGKTSQDKLADAAAEAQSAQPTGYTFLTTKVRTKLPFLLKHSLREYQHIGLDWLVTMYEKRLNGILADEMGLGKTIMTIALLAHLACDRGIWGPHLIVVPTSVMLNWETEFMKWCPAFKILTYFGSAKERKYKRQGWSKQNSFHVCITTYRLVIQDAKAFRRKKWKYLILDEAHLIKNWKSQRWQTLLNFNSKRRILLTGTPLQNDLMELWSLMHFLMPHVFQSHQEFRDWFSNPITGMVEGQEQINKEVVDRLHNVLRPFLLRRLKQDVEKQLPGKFEHVVRCRLSKRQRNLYEDFMANSDTQATLASGNFLGLINVLMQLRKVCNHPDLFEGRPIMSSFDMSGLSLHLSSLASSTLHVGPFSTVNLRDLNLFFSQLSFEMAAWECEEVVDIQTSAVLIEELSSTGVDSWDSQGGVNQSGQGKGLIEELQSTLRAKRAREKKEKIHALTWLNTLRCKRRPLYGLDLIKYVLVEDLVHDVHKIKADKSRFLEFSSVIADMVKLPLTRLDMVLDLVKSFVFAIPAARAPAPLAWCSHPTSSTILLPTITGNVFEKVSASLEPLRPVFARRQLFFPDRRLLQFDCGKLQELALLLRRLKSEGHRALIFTQMTKMLDVLEGFISLYGYTYMRLDGSTKPEQRQILMQRFNTNPKIFLFILSTRSGGVGINLVGADTVIFYDSDWNPAMDQQAQDRCHRIGQTREVHIYRLVCESTIEENILKKANQKRVLDDLVIQSGSYNTEFFKKLDPMELFSGLRGVRSGGNGKVPALLQSQPLVAVEASDHDLSSAEVEAALKNAEDEADYMAMKRVEQEEAAENQEFTEEAFAGNLDEEDFADEMEDGKIVLAKNQTDGGVSGTLRNSTTEGGNKVPITDEVLQIGTSLIAADVEEEMDMLADVKQMAAAAAAAGRGSTSFEDQLRPVERYAMRFLELWDPRVDKASEAQVLFEEKEWELDQLEKLKEEQEAEIDEDNEPLFYESWDTAFANEAYRQQVEVLAQQQENQRQLEWEAIEEEMRDADRAVVEASSAVTGAEGFKLKSSSLKKLKKAKFRSLKKGSLGSEELMLVNVSGQKDGTYVEPQSEMSLLASRSPSLRKRKAPKSLEEGMSIEEYAKRLKKDSFKYRMLGEKNVYSNKSSQFDHSCEVSDEDTWAEAPDLDSGDVQSKFLSSSGANNKLGGKISIMAWPLKKGPLITLEKERKKDAAKMQEHIAIPDLWTSPEDAILCAVVHEYGGNWQLASDVLAGMPDGSVYRGRHRHSFHCRERFRRLLSQHAYAASGDPSSERSALNASSNTHLKVTEEHTKRLLEVVLQLPDNELLLQRHFGAVLTAVRNMLAKRRAGIEKPVAPSNLVSPRQDGDFISLSNTSNPKLPSYVPTCKKGLTANSSRDMQQIIAKSLKDIARVETRGSSNMKVSVVRQLGNEADKEIQQDHKFNISEFLDLDSGQSVPSDQCTDFSLLKYTPVVVSVEDILGLNSPTPVLAPSSALRCSAENIADQRFRNAMSIGWGAGLYEWAAAAASGLGSSGIPRGKSKKRPPPADSTKPPKPKQARISKASKKVSSAMNPSTSSNPTTKKKKSQPAGLLPSAGNAKKTPKEGGLQAFSKVNYSAHMGPEATEMLEHLPPGEQASRTASVEKVLEDKITADTSVRVESKEGTLRSTALTGTMSPKVRTSKLKKRNSSPIGALKKSVKGKSSAQVVTSINLEKGGSGGPLQELSRKADPETVAGDVASAQDDSSSGSDDVVITGVSLPSELDSKFSIRIKEGGPTGEMQRKAWSEGVNIARFTRHTDNESDGPSPNWGPAVGGEALKTSQDSRPQVVVQSIPRAEQVAGSHQRKKGGTWVPPAEMLASAGALSSVNLRSDSLKRLSSEFAKRVPSSGALDVSPGFHPNAGEGSSRVASLPIGQNQVQVSELLPLTTSFPGSGAQLSDGSVHLKARSNQLVHQEGKEGDDVHSIPQIPSSAGSGLGVLPSPFSAENVLRRPPAADQDQGRSIQKPVVPHSGSSPGKARHHPAAVGRKLTLRSTSPHQRHDE